MTDSLDEIWALTPGERRQRAVSFIEPQNRYPSAFDVEWAAKTSVAASILAAGEFGARRGLSPSTPDSGNDSAVDAGGEAVDAGGEAVDAGGEAVSVDHALAAFSSHLRVDGEAIPTWADLSGRYETADGRHVQIHANFAHHAEGVAQRLGVAADRAAVAEAIGTWEGEELERTLIDDGMICALYRTQAEWDAHPQAEATRRLPVLEVTRIGDAPALGHRPTQDRALDGIRVLDCSRVLAGPVCGQTLAAHGADVLRIGAPHLPSVPLGVISTGFGKRNAFLDLDSVVDRRRFGQLLADANVFVDAYRPGAMGSRGFGAEAAAAIKPGIVVIEICAFDWVGPWAGRRGFDSIVQTTTGLAMTGAEQSGSALPVHLPVQALDHATGYLAAFAATRLLDHGCGSGGSWRVRLSLLRTRNWLVANGDPAPFAPAPNPDVSAWVHTVASPFGSIEAVRPVAGRWDLPPTPLGSATASWAQR